MGAGAWRFVQCNWGARHLVNAKEVPKPGKAKSDSLRYEYDDHYFLTDPKEFIYEFFPLQPEWQLLKEPINLEEFEELPFVRSLFFRYQLAFPTEHMKSVMTTDQTGEQPGGEIWKPICNFILNTCLHIGRLNAL